MVQPLNSAPPAPPTRRADEAVDVLISAVLDGTHPPGSVLPPERDLAARMGMSRTSVRQAITRLAQLGVVEPMQGRGTVVRDISETTDATLIERVTRGHGIELVGEVLEVREAMGALAGRLAAQRAQPADTRALEDSLAEARAAEDPATLQRAELALFVNLISAAGNRPLRTMMRWVEQAYGGAAGSFTAAFEDREAVVRELDAIVGAVRDGDTERAAAAVEAYAASSATRMLDALGDARS